MMTGMGLKSHRCAPGCEALHKPHNHPSCCTSRLFSGDLRSQRNARIFADSLPIQGLRGVSNPGSWLRRPSVRVGASASALSLEDPAKDRRLTDVLKVVADHAEQAHRTSHRGSKSLVHDVIEVGITQLADVVD
jgi:hypothetical protein